MADFMRLSQPLLRDSIRLTPLQILLCPRRNISTTLSRSRAPSYSRKPSANAASRRLMKNTTTQLEGASSFLLPTTLVAPPIWRYPRQFSKFFHMLWLHGKVKFQCLYTLLGLKITSCPKPFASLPLFKAQRSTAIPTAKALHIQMSEALAAGDRETLRAICSPEYHRLLVGVIDARPKGVRTQWELIEYEQTWYYPRLADWRVVVIPRPNGPLQTLKQAVVSIASVQRIARYDDTKGGAKIKGSERVRHMLEHIVLQAQIDDKTYQHGPWKIWGTVPESTYESYLEGLAIFQAANE